MKEKLKRITIKEAHNIILDKEVLKRIGKEPILRLEGVELKKKKNNPLLDLEITLRKCERVGVFEK